ncbi:MAG: protein-L-isoaspartate(D-aspartate) O-methyltransferase [bacterium]|nr:protein-L-isoaspartate(D-aspartate) O-methyltransferase [bacterium]
MASDPYRHRRQQMVRKQIEARGVGDPRVLRVMGEVPRHLFVREHLHPQAYGDFALPIECGQTISQPYVVARMTELLDVSSEHSVLEIGTGSGYQTLVLARLGGRVFSLERIAELARRAIERLRPFELDNVKIQAFDGTFGWSDVGPFDRILVTAAAPHVPPPLIDQLKEGGKLVVPEGGRDGQRLILYEKTAEGLGQSTGEAVSFVPLIGRHGWAEVEDG